MKYKSVRLLCLSLLVYSFLAIPALAQQFERSRLELANKRGKPSIFLRVELAYTYDERIQGLMHRAHLPQGEGMLFDFEEKQVMNMWMKNTPIALDMFFADSRGIIFHIAENTTPFSLDTISSELPGRYVLELPAGSAEQLGIELGDKILAPRKNKPAGKKTISPVVN